jgi:hypothetical protein
MKTTCIFLFFFSTLIFPQTFLDVSYINADPSNSTNLNLIQKITFSGADINFLLTDNSSVLKVLSSINKITFSGTDGGNPLPVELVSFTGVANGYEVTLEWSTATEVDNYGFDVERTNPVLNPLPRGEENLWEKVGFVEGHGNSNSPKKYSFTDIPQKGTSFQYRLKQIDSDGKYSYCDAISVDIGLPNQYVLNQNYPNPFNPTTTISYKLPEKSFTTLKIYDALSNEVVSLVNEQKEAGSYSVTFNGSNLASGVYFSRLTAGSYTSLIKMILAK